VPVDVSRTVVLMPPNVGGRGLAGIEPPPALIDVNDPDATP
jgi:hypothetical protein